jgi:hypothetical protein
MSVVRLELTVPDDDAHDVGNRLVAEYFGVIGDVAHGNVLVEVRSDEDALRERTILAAARYFMPSEPSSR